MQRALLNRATMRVAVNPLIQLKETAAVQQFNLNKNVKKEDYLIHRVSAFRLRCSLRTGDHVDSGKSHE